MGRKPANVLVKRTTIPVSPHSRQSCEATYRNAIEAQRDPEVSQPVGNKTVPNRLQGRWRACAAKVHVLIRGDLHSLAMAERRSSE